MAFTLKAVTDLISDEQLGLRGRQEADPPTSVKAIRELHHIMGLQV